MKKLIFLIAPVLLIIYLTEPTFAQSKPLFKTTPDFHFIPPDSVNHQIIHKTTDSISYIELPLLKNEYLVNQGCGNYGSRQYSINIATDKDGNYCVVWTDLRNGTEDIYAQVFDKNGNRTGSNVLVSENNVEWNVQPYIAATPEGDYIISWTQYSDFIAAQRLSKSGEKIGNNFKVNNTIGSNANDPCVAVDDSGNFVITWDMFVSGNKRNMYARVYNKFGEPIGDEFKINNSVQAIGGSGGYGNRIAVDSNGNFGIVWAESYFGAVKIILQFVNAESGMIGNNILVSDIEDPVNNYFPSISCTDDGYFLIGWETINNGDDEIAAKIYKFGEGLITNKIVFSPDSTQWVSRVRISTDRANNFILFWDGENTYAEKISKQGNWYFRNYILPSNLYYFEYPSNILNGELLVASTVTIRTDNDVAIQKIDSSFNLIGNQVKVNDDICSSFQLLPEIAFNPYGESIVVWEDMRNGYRDIYAQVYDSTFTPTNENVLINDSVVTSWWDVSIVVTSLSDGTFITGFIQKRNEWDSFIYFQKIGRDGTRIRNNKMVVGKGYKRDIYIKTNRSDEILLVWTDYYNNAYIQKFDEEFNSLTASYNFFKSSEGTESRLIKSISINGNLDVMVTYLSKAQGSNDYRNYLYSRFFNSDGINISAQNIIDTLYDGTYVAVKSCFEDNKNYTLTQSSGFSVKVKNKYDNDTTQYIHYIYLYNGYLYDPLILKSENKKSLISIRTENEIKGYFIDDTKNIVKIFSIHNFTNPSLIFGGEYKSYAVKFNKDKIFVAYTANQLDGKGYDIWSKVFDASQLDFSLIPIIVPDKFDILYGNYPNPVNGITKIAFKLAFPRNVKITLYDILGNSLGKVINEFRNEGYQEVDVDVSRLASGVYIYKIEANNTLISKFVVVK